MLETRFSIPSDQWQTSDKRDRFVAREQVRTEHDTSHEPPPLPQWGRGGPKGEEVQGRRCLNYEPLID